MQRGKWHSQFGFILAAVGSAIGLGNVWRFPYLCYKHGGGAFLIPFALALFSVGIPLLILEIGLGHLHRGSAPLAFHRIAPKWEWIGWFPLVFVMFGIMFYYNVILGWCISFLGFSLTKAWGSDPSDFFFNRFLALSGSVGEIGGLRIPLVFGMAIAWIITWFICFRRVEHGIERACKIFIPVLFILTGFMIVYVLIFPGLEGAREGLRFYLKPDLSALARVETWTAAYGQVFFSLSIGFGIMLAYASYLPEKARIVRGAVLTGVLDCSFSLISGLAVFGVVGHLAHAKNVPVDEVIQESVGLAFVVYPETINRLPEASQVFGMVFFLLLILAGVSSGISIVESIAAGLHDKFGFHRGRNVSALCGAGMLGSLLFCHRAGLYWLDIVDHFIQTYGLLIVGLLECLLIGWVFKISLLEEHLMANSRMGRRGVYIWKILIRGVAPITLLGLLSLSGYNLIRNGYGGYPVWALARLGALWVIAALVTGLVLSRLSWRREPFYTPDADISTED